MGAMHTYRYFAESADYPYNVINFLQDRSKWFSPDTDFPEVTSEIKDAVEWMVENLPDRERDVFCLYFKERKTVKEVADKYDTFVQNVNGWYQQAGHFLLYQYRILFLGGGYNCKGKTLCIEKRNGTHIKKLDCSNRLYNCLLISGFITIEDVTNSLETNVNSIIKIRGMGIKGFGELLFCLDKHYQTGNYYRQQYFKYKDPYK